MIKEQQKQLQTLQETEEQQKKIELAVSQKKRIEPDQTIVTKQDPEMNFAGLSTFLFFFC